MRTCAPSYATRVGEPARYHPAARDELRAAIRNTFVAVREYARAKLPHATADINDYTYSYKLPKEDEPSGGLSAGLPSALAFLSTHMRDLRLDGCRQRAMGHDYEHLGDGAGDDLVLRGAGNRARGQVCHDHRQRAGPHRAPALAANPPWRGHRGRG